MRAPIIRLFCTMMLTFSFLFAMAHYTDEYTWQETTWILSGAVLGIFSMMLDATTLLDAVMNELANGETND